MKFPSLSASCDHPAGAGLTTAGYPAWDGLDLPALLTLQPDGQGVSPMRFSSCCSEDNRNGRVFGGQLLGQALRAAQATVSAARPAVALQLLFAQGALTNQPILYEVSVLQEGKRFSGRRIEARQGDRLLISAHASFQLPEDGLDHALAPYQAVAPPEQLIALSDLTRTGGPAFAGFDWSWFQKPCLELRVVDPEEHLLARSPAPQVSFWMRLRVPLADDPALHACALAYLSDYWINTAAITHHIALKDVMSQVYVASLTHSLWLHRPCRADDWLLFSTKSPSAQSGRGLTNARIYDRTGVLVASVAQECLLARRD